MDARKTARSQRGFVVKVPRAGPLLALVVLAAFFLRLAWQIAIGFYSSPEVFEYDEIARNLLQGRGYVFDFLGTEWVTYGLPVYPLVLALLHAIGGGPTDYSVVGVAQAVLSAAVAALTFEIARRLSGDDRVGLAAALAVAAHPGLLLYAAKVHELNLEAPVSAALLLAVLAATRPASGATALGLGIASFVAALVRPTLALFAGSALVVLALRAPRRSLAFAGVVLVAGALLTTGRNLIALGTDGPAAPGTCVLLWVGNNPDASGGSFTKEGHPIFEAMPARLEARVVGRPEQEQGRAFCEEALSFMTADLVAAGAWWAQKFAYFWWFSPSTGALYPSGWIDLYRWAYAVEVVLALVGAFALWNRGFRAGLVFVALQALAVSLAQSFFYVEGRHRLLLEPSLATLAAAGFFTVLGSTAVMLRQAGHYADIVPTWLRRRT